MKQFQAQLVALNPLSLLTPQSQQTIEAQFNKLGTVGHQMFPQLMDAVKTSLTFGIQRLFEVGLLFASLCCIGTFFLPEVKLKGREYFDEARVVKHSFLLLHLVYMSMNYK